MSLSHQGAELRYQAIRAQARQAADEVLSAEGLLSAGFRSSAFDPEGLRRCAQWPDRTVSHWDWSAIYGRYRRSEPSRFELAVWQDAVLCALAIGKSSKTDAYVSIDFLEGNPDIRHPLKGKVIEIVTVHLEFFGAALGKREARLVSPISDRLVEVYRDFGYHLVIPAGKGAPRYCGKALEGDGDET
jgi:hypothetical protein